MMNEEAEPRTFVRKFACLPTAQPRCVNPIPRRREGFWSKEAGTMLEGEMPAGGSVGVERARRARSGIIATSCAWRPEREASYFCQSENSFMIMLHISNSCFFPVFLDCVTYPTNQTVRYMSKKQAVPDRPGSWPSQSASM